MELFPTVKYFMHKNPAFSKKSSPISCLKGNFAVPGDKSISHRALMFGALATGKTTITGLLEGEDVFSTAAALKQMGAEITQSDHNWHVTGVGTAGLQAPQDILDMGNSGTSARLLMGVLAPFDFPCFFTGDASLRKRPMKRVITPLEKMNARFHSTGEGRFPLLLQGAGKHALPITYELPVASAQVKSAILLAGLNTPGQTTVIEPIATRDHTENMLRAFGATVQKQDTAITIDGYAQLIATDVSVPSDPSSAAFPIVAALVTPNSKIELSAIGMNPLRTGLIKTLLEMGANITVHNERQSGGEPVADLIIESSRLKGVTVPAERAASMIDEYPILAVAASFAKGQTYMPGLEELRVKESDRLAAMETGLKACGVDVSTTADSMTINGGEVIGNATVAVHLDHRIAMSFLVLGCAAKEPVTIDNAAAIATSFPNFVEGMNQLGAAIK